MIASTIITGAPGQTWTNTTARVSSRFHCSLANVCGRCLQYHLKISPAWPIPMHQNCRCWQVPISPGREAPQPFCDFRKLLDQMPEHNREAAIGASNYRLLKRGLAKWSDIVTPYRVRDFHEVVSLLKLPVATMVAAGVRRYLAVQAQARKDQTPEQHEARHRAGLYAGLASAGQSQERLVGMLSNAVGVVGGAAGIAMAAQMPGHGAELAGLIAAWRPKRKKTQAVADAAGKGE